jgi:hypothetical protein
MAKTKALNTVIFVKGIWRLEIHTTLSRKKPVYIWLYPLKTISLADFELTLQALQTAESISAASPSKSGDYITVEFDGERAFPNIFLYLIRTIASLHSVQLDLRVTEFSFS